MEEGPGGWGWGQAPLPPIMSDCGLTLVSGINSKIKRRLPRVHRENSKIVPDILRGDSMRTEATWPVTIAPPQ